MSSLIEYDANTQLASNQLDGELRPVGGGSLVGEIQTNLLELAWRARWLILLMSLLGLGGAWLVLQRVTPRYTALSRIYVERNLPRILDTDYQMGQSSSYLYTQAELIRSSKVLAAAVKAPGNAHLETFRETDSPVGLLRQNLQVQVGKNDDIINIAIELPNAGEAAQIVNSVVDAYIAKYAEKRSTDAAGVLTILRNEKQRLDAELEQRQQALTKFRQENAALAVQVGEDNVITQRFSALAAKLDETELALLDAKARYTRTQQMFEAPSQRPFLLELAVSQQQNNSEFRVEHQMQIDLERQIQDVQLRIASEQASWGNGHPRVKLMLKTLDRLEKRLEDQLAAVVASKEAMVAAYVETFAQEYKLLEQKRAELQRNYDTQFQLAMQVTSQAQKLATLEDALARTVRMVDILDGQIKDVNLSDDVGPLAVSIMDVAQPTSIPTYPIPPRFLAVGGILGALSGFGLAWLRDLMDHRLRSLDEIANTLQLPVLGALPLGADRDDRAAIGRILLAQPRSMAAEAFRTLRTAIHFGLTRDEAKVIAITSPSPGDGKSIVASNLALAMAQADQRVLLIDADMRKPTQHKIFAIEVKYGLASVLSERRPVEEIIQQTEIDSLDLLPCGSLPANPVELLNNGYFGQLLDELQGQYDKIVIDSPPVMPVADARVISAQTDATILVLRAERSTRRLSIAARDELWRVRAQRLGVVVNAVPGRKQASYASGYGYGYGEYGYGHGAYGDEAYGVEPQISNGRRKKSRALATASVATASDTIVESADG